MKGSAARTIIALAVGGALGWLADWLGNYPEFTLRDILPPLCAASLAVAWHNKLHDASQGILLCFMAGIATSIFAAVGEVMLYNIPLDLPVPLLVFLPEFLSVLVFLLVCSYFILRPGWKPMFAGAIIAGLVRLVLWGINMLTLPEPVLPLWLPQWSWMAGAGLALLLWPREEGPPAGIKWVEDPEE